MRTIGVLFMLLVAFVATTTTGCGGYILLETASASRNTSGFFSGPPIEITNNSREADFLRVVDQCGRVRGDLSLSQTARFATFSMGCLVDRQVNITVKGYRVMRDSVKARPDTAYVGLASRQFQIGSYAYNQPWGGTRLCKPGEYGCAGY